MSEASGSLRALRTFLDRVPIPVGMADIATGEIEYFNQAFTDAIGYSVDDVPTLELWYATAYPDPEVRADVLVRWAEALEVGRQSEGAIPPIEVQLTTSRGPRPYSICGVLYEGKLLAYFQDLTDLRWQAEHKIRQDAFHRAVIANAADGVCVCHPIPDEPFVHFTVWNRRMTELTGYTLEEINRRGWYQSLYPDPEVRQRASARMDAMREGQDLVGEEWTITRQDGEERQVSISTSLLPAGEDGDDQSPHVLAIVRDITDRERAVAERLELQGRIQHAQKLESLGVLAGGIAHDFNNILMTILGRASLAELEIPENHEAHSHLEELQAAAHRAAELCRQMLAYSGKGRFVIEPVDLRRLVEEMGRMLEVSISKKVQLRYEFPESLPTVLADATQLRQVVMNLITNGSEAIGDENGSISLHLGAQRCSAEYLAHSFRAGELPAGEYVALEVTDTGAGMSEETQQRLFEPFFTTKFTGRGLGMSATLGIVQGHGGAIRVYSELGKGTTIKILLPAVQQSAPLPSPPARPPTLAPGQRILVVDDEEAVRRLTVVTLQTRGFLAEVARDGKQAVEIYRARGDEIAAVILDLTMPEMDGEETFRELRQLDPDVRVLLTSGYNQHDVTQRFVGRGLAGFLQKPYSVTDLVRALAEALGEDGSPSE